MEIKVIQLNELDAFKGNYQEATERLTELLNKRLDKNKVNELKDCLKKLQEKTELSIEHIKYLLITDKEDGNHKKAIRLIKSETTEEIKPQITKLYRLLKANNIKTKQEFCYFRKLKRWNNNITRQLNRRIIHQFTI